MSKISDEQARIIGNEIGRELGKVVRDCFSSLIYEHQIISKINTSIKLGLEAIANKLDNRT